jgi:4-diphosphocytidyl-2-C-methyl-D-erythritol kinase
MTSATARGVRVEAPAKLNLVLRILAREASGYHGIESLFIKVALHDIVTIRTDVTGRSLHCDGPTMPAGGLGAPEDNLAWRAAERFADATGWPTGFDIAIEKHIPVGGGLGGGSADAAAVLRGLNTIAPAPLPMHELLAIAGTLGSDVPFLTSDAVMAWTWGRGDRLLALPPLPERAVLLAAFSTGVNTGAAYGAFAAKRAAAGPAGGVPLAVAYPADAFTSWSQVARFAANDFESVVPALHAGVAAVLPVVRSMAAALGDAERPAIGLMSGSGATCFVLFSGDRDVHVDLGETLEAGAAAGDAAPAEASLLAALAQVHWLETRTACTIVAPQPIL